MEIMKWYILFKCNKQGQKKYVVNASTFQAQFKGSFSRIYDTYQELCIRFKLCCVLYCQPSQPQPSPWFSDWLIEQLYFVISDKYNCDNKIWYIHIDKIQL